MSFEFQGQKVKDDCLESGLVFILQQQYKHIYTCNKKVSQHLPISEETICQETECRKRDKVNY